MRLTGRRRIGFGATISAPHMHAHAVENLLPLISDTGSILDVGSGSGYRKSNTIPSINVDLSTQSVRSFTISLRKPQSSESIT